LQLRNRAFVHHVTSIHNRIRFDQHDANLIRRHGPMLDTFGHNDELARLEVHRAVPEFHVEPARNHVKHFILEFVMMPNELALKLDKFDRDIVGLPDDFGAPMVGEQLEFLGHIDFIDLNHANSLPLSQKSHQIRPECKKAEISSSVQSGDDSALERSSKGIEMTSVTRANTPNPVVAVLFIAVLALTLAGILLINQRQKAKDAARQATWTQTTARVTESGWRTFDRTRFVGKNVEAALFGKPYTYIPSVSFSYSVNGASHSGRVEFRKHLTKNWNALADARGINARYPVGFEIPIRYNPGNPNEHVLVQELK
jgi:Protein of unknown function (DUF3592)